MSLSADENRQALQHRGLGWQIDEDEANRYRKICEAQFQLKDIITQFDESGMFIVAAELRTVEKRVNDVVENLRVLFEI